MTESEGESKQQGMGAQIRTCRNTCDRDTHDVNGRTRKRIIPICSFLNLHIFLLCIFTISKGCSSLSVSTLRPLRASILHANRPQMLSHSLRTQRTILCSSSASLDRTNLNITGIEFESSSFLAQVNDTPKLNNEDVKIFSESADFETDVVDVSIPNEPSSSIETEVVPSYLRIIKFVSTTVLIWLSEPLLSLVDTTVVGQFAGTSDLTALGPATMLCDSIMYSLWFLAIATTNRLTTAKAKEDEAEVQRVISHGMGVAIAFGLLSTVFTLVAGPSLLFQILGGDNAMDIAGAPVSQVVQTSFQYSAIRTLVAPFSVMSMVAQAVCLSSQDMQTPIVAVAVASIVNVVGDLLFVKSFKMGANGAALATAIATVLSTVVLIKATRKIFMQSRHRENQSALHKEEEFPAIESEKQHFIALPSWNALLELLPLAGPIFGVMMGKIVCYNALSLKANTFGMLPCAAHNILLRIYFFFGTFGDAICQAGQTFFPGVLYSRISQQKGADGDEKLLANEARTSQKTKKQLFFVLFKRLFVIGAATSFVNAMLGMQVTRGGAKMFTSDARLKSLIGQNGIWMATALLAHPFALLLEGTLIASRDLAYLAWSYLATLGVLMGLLKFCAQSFVQVWQIFFAFQSFRVIQFSLRVGQQVRKIDSSSNDGTTES